MLSSVVILSLAFALWAAVHSLLAARWSKELARQVFGSNADRWYRLAYNLFALLSLVPLLLLLALLPDNSLYSVPSPWSWLLRAGQGLALAGLVASFLQTDPWQFAGVSQLVDERAGQAETLVVHGFYCRVRHPLYFFSSLLVWLNPTMTLNWLATSILITLYFYLGALHEERRLLTQYGQAYALYQKRVPMLVPRPGRCVAPGQQPV